MLLKGNLMFNEAILDVTVSTKSSRSEIIIDETNNIKLYVNSPPIDGKANAECIVLFTKKLCIAKSKIRIVKGKRCKRKRIVIHGITKEEVIDKLKGEKL